MKKYCLSLIALCCLLQMQAQIYGNGKIVTQTRNIENIEKILVNINGELNIICGSNESKVEITYDENIIDLLSSEKIDGVIEFAQKKWIEGTKEVVITVYLNELQILENDSWSKIKVSNIDQDQLKVISTISTIELSGKVNQVELISKNSTINAFQLIAKDVTANIKENGKIYTHASQKLSVNCEENGLVKYQGTPNEISGLASSNNSIDKPQTIDTRFIEVRFKNNGLSKIHAYVKGPKPDGNYFSYGLSFFPMLVKKEKWSIGTKLYRVNKLGIKTLLHEVKAEDEGKLIKLRK